MSSGTRDRDGPWMLGVVTAFVALVGLATALWGVFGSRVLGPTSSTTPTTIALPTERLLLADADLVPVCSDGIAGTAGDPVPILGFSYDASLVTSLSASDQSASECVWTVSANREWSEFWATVGIADTAPIESSAFVEVVGDGQVLLAQALRHGEAFPVLVDVTGVQYLQLRVVNTGGVPVMAAWGQARLLEVPSQ